ncbi:Uncharacterised protein [Mycobacterium tuberculosis]|nr:Uncharacterised protein [Mycobacterium tuberculosis]
MINRNGVRLDRVKVKIEQRYPDVQFFSILQGNYFLNIFGKEKLTDPYRSLIGNYGVSDFLSFRKHFPR